MSQFAEALRTDATVQEQIQYIDVDRIDPDPNNFYELSNVDELAANIELIGLQQPLRVRVHPDDPTRYMIVSGHRRRAALRQLVEDGKEQYRLAQCIVEQAAASDALQELRLIYANSDTRRMTNAEISKQAERVEMLLYELKEQGMEFPGRMRDHVAEACKVSKSKPARLKVIREKLIPELQELFAKDQISEDAAYTAARESEQIQRYMAMAANKGKSLAWQLEKVRQTAVRNRTGWCDIRSSECDHYEARMRAYVMDEEYLTCNGKCCVKCDFLRLCRYSCRYCATEKEKRIAEKEQKDRVWEEENSREQERKKAAREAREQKELQLKRQQWKNFGERRATLGMTPDAFYNDLIDGYFGPEDLGQIQRLEKGEAVNLYEDSPLDYMDYLDLCMLAGELQCSLDYLFGRTATPEPPAAQLDSTPVWHDPRKGDLPEEGQEVIAAVQYCPPNGKWTTEDLTFRDGVFMGFGVPLDEGIPLYWQQKFEPPVPNLDTSENENEEELN